MPLAIVSVVVAGISAVLVAVGAVSTAAPLLPIVLAGFAFAASIIGLCKMGLNNMREAPTARAHRFAEQPAQSACAQSGYSGLSGKGRTGCGRHSRSRRFQTDQ